MSDVGSVRRVGDVEVRVSYGLVVVQTRQHPALTPEEARELAMSLIDAANEISDSPANATHMEADDV